MSTTTLDQAKAELNKRGFLNLDTPGVDYVAEINRLKEEKNAVILAHYYQEILLFLQEYILWPKLQKSSIQVKL